MTYELEKGSNGNGGERTPEAQGADGLQPEWAHGGGEGAGGAGGVDGAGETGAGDEGDGDQLPGPAAVAGPGDGGDAAGAGEPGEPGGWSCPLPAAQGAAPEAPVGERPREADGTPGAHPGGCPGGRFVLQCLSHASEGDGAATRGSDHAGQVGAADGEGGGGPVGGLAQNLLRVGGAGVGGDAPAVGGPDGGPATEPGVGGGNRPAGESGGAGAEARCGGADRRDPRRAPGDGSSGG